MASPPSVTIIIFFPGVVAREFLLKFLSCCEIQNESNELAAEDIWQQGEGLKDASLKAILLHRPALWVELGEQQT